MYRYDEFDHAFVRERVASSPTRSAAASTDELTEDEFKPLRLMNGVYLQLHAYMLRVAIPYGALNGRRLRKLAHIARTYDKGYGHFTTRHQRAVQLARPGGRAGDPVGAGRGRDARHPDLRQLHPQRHGRPLRRRAPPKRSPTRGPGAS